MSSEIVLDSTSLLNLLERQDGWEEVVDVFIEALEADKRLLLNMVSWGEMLNMAGRTYSDYSAAERALRSIESLSIQWVDGNRETERRAALVFRNARLSYAASHAAARAMQGGGELVTGDPEFRRVENDVTIRWIGSAGAASFLRDRDPQER